MSPRCSSDRTWEAVDWTLETSSSSESGFSGIKSLVAMLWSSSYWSTLIRRNAMLVQNLKQATQVHLRRSLVQSLVRSWPVVNCRSAVELKIPCQRRLYLKQRRLQGQNGEAGRRRAFNEAAAGSYPFKNDNGLRCVD